MDAVVGLIRIRRVPSPYFSPLKSKRVAALEIHFGGHRRLIAVEQDDLHRDHISTDCARHAREESCRPAG